MITVNERGLQLCREILRQEAIDHPKELLKVAVALGYEESFVLHEIARANWGGWPDLIGEYDNNCQKGVVGCKCAVGFPYEEQCVDCRDTRDPLDNKSRCVCPPKINT